MARATWVLAATTVAFASTTLWLYVSPREVVVPAQPAAAPPPKSH